MGANSPRALTPEDKVTLSCLNRREDGMVSRRPEGLILNGSGWFEDSPFLIPFSDDGWSRGLVTSRGPHHFHLLFILEIVRLVRAVAGSWLDHLHCWPSHTTQSCNPFIAACRSWLPHRTGLFMHNPIVVSRFGDCPLSFLGQSCGEA
jgi:hypothetical protein